MDGLTHPRCVGKYHIDGCFAAVSYTKIIKKVLYTYKYKPYLSDVKSVISDLFYESIIQQEKLMQVGENAILVPIPLHTKRLKNRGYDQVYLLAKELAIRSNLQVIQLLKRVKETKSQYGLKRSDRQENLHDAFLCSKKSTTDTTVFLLDDIVTSGATLVEAARVLKKAGYRTVYGLAFAHGQ